MRREDESESEADQENDAVKVEKMRIVNVLQDGTIWVWEKLENGEKNMLHTNIYGEVLKTYEIPSSISRIYGVDDNDKLVVEEGEEEEIKIYDVETQEAADSFYIGNYDKIKNYIQTENDSVFVVEKTIESFEEKYSCLGLVDSAGKEFFNISLDKDTLMNQYGIEPDGSTTAADRTINYAGNNVYYIAYIASDLCRENNSLIIDLNRNKIIPVSFPQRLSGFGCESDGNHALVDCPLHGTLMIDLENDLITRYRIEDNFSLSGSLSEGLIRVEKGNKKAYADTQGNIVIDLNQYSQYVKYAWPFDNGAALIEFGNGYMTYIDVNGEFLFEPTKGTPSFYYKGAGVAVVRMDDGTMAAIDRNGNITELDSNIYKEGVYVSEGGIKLINYDGKKYWISAGNNKLQVQEYVAASN